MCKKGEMYFIICHIFFLNSIYFLQDTLLDPKLDKYITAEWGFTSYFCSNNTRSRGEAILFNNDFEFKIKGIFRDNGGHFLMVHISTMKMDVLLVNIEGPNRDDPNVYTNLIQTLTEILQNLNYLTLFLLVIGT